MDWIEIVVKNKKSYEKSLEDIQTLLNSIPHKRFHFFFEEEFGINYVLRIETELSPVEANGKIQENKDKLKELDYVFGSYKKEIDNFKPLVEECLDLFHNYSKLALKLIKIPKKDRGKRLRVQDLAHLLANPLGYSIDREAELWSALGARYAALAVLLKFKLLDLKWKFN